MVGWRTSSYISVYFIHNIENIWFEHTLCCIHFVVFFLPIEPFISNKGIKIKKYYLFSYTKKKQFELNNSFGLILYSIVCHEFLVKKAPVKHTIFHWNQLWHGWIFQNAMYSISPFSVSHHLYAEIQWRLVLSCWDTPFNITNWSHTHGICQRVWCF